jgi:vacuolar-type H+-ATPase subunit E/Vma4
MPDIDSNGVDILDRFLAYKSRFMQFSVTEDVFNQVVEYIKELRKERDEAKSKLGRIMEGLEGTCMTCEPVGVRNQQMEQHIKKLQAERDEARREACGHGETIGGAMLEADLRGWDCFRDNK